MPVTYFYSHTKSDGSRRRSVGSDPDCTLDDKNQTEANEESIKIADVNGSTDKTVDVNENTVEVTVHISPDGENRLTLDQENESTSL